MSRIAIWRLIYIVATGLILSMALFFAFFIYQNIYNTLSNTLAIGIINAGTDIDIVDDKAYDKARELVKNKNIGIVVPDKIRNIFINYENSTSTSIKKPVK